MSLLNVMYNATAKNTTLTLLPPKAFVTLLGLPPVIIFAGAGRTKWFDVNQPNDPVVGEVGSDGNLITHISPAGSLVRGTITFNPSSPTLGQLASLTTAQTNAGQVFANTLIIENLSTLTTVQYENFVISKNFVGNSFNQQLEDYEYSFFCLPPNYMDLASITSLAGSI